MDRSLMQRFWGACGASGPLAVRAEDDTGAEVVRQDLPAPFAVIGRDPKADIVLDHEAVSRRHAFVQVIGGRVFWIDPGSRVGVARGGVVAPTGWLEAGEAIEIGPFRVAIAAKGSADNGGVRPNPLADPGPAGWPAAALEFPDHPGGPARWRLSRVLTLVGRGGACRLRIDDRDISRLHCVLLRTPAGPWAVDLASRTGIRADGVRVRCTPLEPGTQLHVGRYRMVVRPVDPSPGEDDESGEADLPPLPRDQLPEVAPRRRPPATKVERPAFEVPAVVGRASELDAYFGRFEQMQQQMFDQFHQMMLAMFQAFGTMQRDQMAQVQQELDRIRELGQELQSLRTESGPPASEAPAPKAPAPCRDPKPAPPPRSDPWVPRDRTDREVHDTICRRIAEIEGERQGRWKRVLDLVTGGAGP